MVISKEPVDAVITWVDGLDAQHIKKLNNYLNTQTIQRSEAASPTRFHQCGEITHCVTSILHFAPWIRTIYIVTDAQTPAIVHELANTPWAEKIKLVDHREIFIGFEHCLPTFNSLSIESMLWRIPGLSDYFIYFNDDCSLIRPVNYEDFFQDNRIVLRGKWKVQNDKKWRNRLKSALSLKKDTSNEHRTTQENSARLAGFNKHFFHLPHIPFPLRKKTFEDFFKTHPKLLDQNSQHPLRYSQQFWPISLAHHLDIQKNEIIMDNTLKDISVHGGCHSLKKIEQRLARADKDENTRFLCLQSLDLAPQSTQELLMSWLTQRISFKG